MKINRYRSLRLQKIECIFSFTIAICIFLVSCQDNTEVKALNCNLLTASKEFTEDSIQVVYRLEAKGDCLVENFFYYDNNQKVTITNPDTIVEILVNLSSQKWMQAGVKGSTIDGSIRVSYTAKSPENTYEAMDQCEQNLIQE